MAKNLDQGSFFENFEKLPPDRFRNKEGKVVDAEGNIYDPEEGVNIVKEAPSEELKRAEERTRKYHPGIIETYLSFKELRKLYLAEIKKEDKLRKRTERKRKR